MIENKNIKSALNEIEKKFGKESIMVLGDIPNADVEVFSSGSILLDNALGINGLPKGKIIEIYGPESSGKTTLTLHAIAEVQKNGGIAAFIDAEHSIDPQYAANIGVDIDNLILSQPDSGEQALEIVDILAKSGNVDLIVVDSVAALVPEAELNGEMKDQQIGAQARLMSKALRKITGNLNKNQTTIIFINQIREKVGVIFGNPETTTGGRAVKFYASIRIEVRKGSQITEGKDILGNEVKFKVVKNKLSAPYKVTQSEILFSKGIDRYNELATIGIENKIFDKKGSWYYYKENNVAQGKAALKTYIESNPEIISEIQDTLKSNKL
ncbi:recombinase RecA [Mycoplasmopsis synoviae]|uniref:Protein RecA n=2 Tax=Mycoplasmopsis synoviae TaxID=2109 RepID=A0AAQ2TCR4_MYCSY|nr:recombinase RecA [Mycoplasmopsis synoviae]AKJ20785.1 RecA protein [Mycoplasmopsis synoviae]AQU48108.1 RecA protein [Mycoplasmopsis synoviae]AWL84335.1 recombinase RecA [Mycoplasmopsis synoviae]QLE14050.1 recombinase RecA [Mycoplasmopsis synoviae]UZF64190.1 recombinase RecA [Mycoplasmopsis synoviae]